MKTHPQPLSMGIEEEYLLIDPETRDLTQRPEGFFAACEAELGPRVAREFYRSQIEVATTTHDHPRRAGEELAHLRSTLARMADRFGIKLVAASMHPFARMLDQDITQRPRYLTLQNELAIVGRRIAVCGMHVHVGVDDNDERIDLMNQMRYFLPHLLTLSTSSPFHEGDDTGMKGYRLTLYQECPRTGLPGRFSSWQEYQDTINVLVQANVIQDATKIWWDIRPSGRYPTLEMRITDVCTRHADAVAIATLYVCLVRTLARLRRTNRTWRQYPMFLLNENRWRAMRYGVQGSLFDFGRGELVPFRYLLEELIDFVRPEAQDLDCEREIDHLRRIVREGTSADRQSNVFSEALACGASNDEALRAVVDHLVKETVAMEPTDVMVASERASAIGSISQSLG